ncbi:G1/S-specific cyclin pas1 [Smittium culicis]|uniref:G1/S-specific cyclin pas1 n=1 Tax=Smittium culicis TaxID=133412 RepID=A0A1R1YQX2_9FUNG|nr:G1/S-specific cyclin pas1 [Smittium culicis]
MNDVTISARKNSLLAAKFVSILFSATVTKKPLHLLSFKKFCNSVFLSTQISTPVVYLALFYMRRLRICQRNITPNFGSEFCIFSVALMLSSKYLDDNTFTTQAWSKVMFIPLPKLLIMQKEFLEAINYKLYVTPEEYSAWLVQLQFVQDSVSLSQDSPTSSLAIPSISKSIPTSPTDKYTFSAPYKRNLDMTNPQNTFNFNPSLTQNNKSCQIVPSSNDQYIDLNQNNNYFSTSSKKIKYCSPPTSFQQNTNANLQLKNIISQNQISFNYDQNPINQSSFDLYNKPSFSKLSTSNNIACPASNLISSNQNSTSSLTSNFPISNVNSFKFVPNPQNHLINKPISSAATSSTINTIYPQTHNSSAFNPKKDYFHQPTNISQNSLLPISNNLSTFTTPSTVTNSNNFNYSNNNNYPFPVNNPISYFDSFLPNKPASFISSSGFPSIANPRNIFPVQIAPFCP